MLSCDFFPSIISRDCIGGYIYQQLNHLYTSPTIGLYMSNIDFIHFCCDIPAFLEGRLEPINSKMPFPVCVLNSSAGQIKLYFMHYHSESEAIKKWEKRASRVDLNRIKIIMDAKANVSQEIVVLFNAIPYDKILLSSGNNIIGIPNTFCMPCYTKQFPPETLLAKNMTSRYIDEYNWKTFILG